MSVGENSVVLFGTVVEVVIVKSDLGLSVALCGENDGSGVVGRCRRRDQSVLEFVEEREMAQMVDSEMVLEAVFCFALRPASDSYIITNLAF